MQLGGLDTVDPVTFDTLQNNLILLLVVLVSNITTSVIIFSAINFVEDLLDTVAKVTEYDRVKYSPFFLAMLRMGFLSEEELKPSKTSNSLIKLRSDLLRETAFILGAEIPKNWKIMSAFGYIHHSIGGIASLLNIFATAILKLLYGAIFVSIVMVYLAFSDLVLLLRKLLCGSTRSFSNANSSRRRLFVQQSFYRIQSIPVWGMEAFDIVDNWLREWFILVRLLVSLAVLIIVVCRFEGVF